ncbi:MAG: AraC family transcriptional regulator [Planctomycetota bacterium]|jgi:AraC-like DNA-binding protein|nr:AraC family transcriptional regulator [Planctomycetota bacterium]
MDKFTIHVANQPRRFPSPIGVNTIGYSRYKRGLVDNGFDCWNFSFILSGEGDYQVDDQRWRVRAPCVITQRPGSHYRYGADEGETWEELFLIYPLDCGLALREARLMQPDRHWWQVGRSGLLHPLLRELRGYANGDPAHHVDRIDRLCERLVLESLLAAANDERSGPEQSVRAIRHEVEMDPLIDHDFDAMAREQGLSPTHFRRLWNRYVGVPPARYRQELLLRRACRELVETNKPITDVATELGFTDPLYFSRRFRAFSGQAPSAYRSQFAITLTLDDL